MPRKRATRVKTHAKPKKPQDDIGSHLDPEERRNKLQVFLKDFDMEVNQRIQRIESDKIRLQTMIEKQLNLQLGYIPVEVRNMNIMDFMAAGRTVEAAMMSLERTRKDSVESDPKIEVLFTSKKARGLRKAKGTADAKTNMAPPSSTLQPAPRQKRSKFQTPMSRKLPAVWDTPAVTPKFDVNLPFTPGLARAPKQGERLMSLAGSPVDISTTQKVTRTLKHTTACISEEGEEDMENAISRLAAAAPHIPATAIHQFLSDFSVAKSQCSSSH